MRAAATGLADVGASDSGGGGKNFLRRGSAWRPDELEPGYATPFRGRGEARCGCCTADRSRSEQQKGARGGGVRGAVSQMLAAVPCRVVDLSSASDARGIDSVIAAALSALNWDAALKPAGARWGCRLGANGLDRWDPPY
ncbi:hypothetical protein MKX08_006952 [Trichoderma sp. CBMAI-0020]|nr:hypothetical protein MKX08_006952 [Trichoderma sp. CBMAI-0020]